MSQTSEKQRVLDGLIRTAEAISVMFGSSCETLVHDMKQPGHPVAAIFNSHVSGRTIGSTATIFGTDEGPVEIDYDAFNAEDAVNTLAVTNTGHYIKSTSIRFQGKDYHYVLGINYDYTPILAASNVLKDLTTTASSLGEHIDLQKKQARIDDIFDECAAMIGKPAAKMKKGDKMKLIALLREKKAFDYQKSVSYVAERLGISRYTVYKYLHEIEEGF